MTKAVEEQTVSTNEAARVGVLVLGMHRSGTSALTRVLNLVGCDQPKTLMGENSANETGHWESNAIMQFNDEVLASAGTNWHDWLGFNTGWYSSPKISEFREKALAVLNEEFGASRLFVLKDPRICRFAPFWLDVLRAANVRPAVILPVRNPLEVAESLAKRDGLDPALGHLLWLRSVLEAEAATRGLQRFHCSYEGLLDSWPRLLSDMQEQLEVSWPRMSNMVSEEIGGFLTDRLRHHHETAESVADNPLLSAWLRDTFAIFHRWSEEGESKKDHSALDSIRGELDGAAPAFARLISVGRQSTQKAKELDAGLKDAQEKLRVAEVAAAAQQQRVEQSEQLLEETRTALSSSEANAAEKERQIAETAEHLAAARSELADVQTEAQSLRAELEDSRSELSHTQSALAQRSMEADETAEHLAAARSELADVQTEAQSLGAKLEDSRSELSHTQSALAQRSMEADETAEHLAAARSELVAVQTEAYEAAKHLAKARSELADAQTEVDETTGQLQKIERRLSEAETARREEAERANRLAAELEKVNSDKRTTEERLSERFSEIAGMTRLLGEKEAAVAESGHHADWLREVSAILMNTGEPATLKDRFEAFFSTSNRLKKQKARLKKQGIFDSDAYLAAHADVAESGIDPLWHYINHGLGEGRERG